MKSVLLVLAMALILMEKEAILFVANAQIKAPRQCMNYTNVKEQRIAGTPTTIYTYISSTSLCAQNQTKNLWYRFNVTLNVPFQHHDPKLFGSPGNKKCTKNGVALHPCRAYETITGTVCFEDPNGRSVGRTVNITNCGSFYVYQLFQLNCTENSVSISRILKKSDPPHTNCNVSSHENHKVVTPTSIHITERKPITMTTRLSSKIKTTVNMTTEAVTKTKKPLDITITMTNTMAKIKKTVQMTTQPVAKIEKPLDITILMTNTIGKTTPPETMTKTMVKTMAKTTANLTAKTTATTTPQNELDNDVFINLENQVNKLDSKNVSQKIREKKAKDIIKKLLHETNPVKKKEAGNENGMKTQALNDTVRILKKIVRLNISARNLPLLGPANNILDRRNRKSWQLIANDTIIGDLVKTLEDYAFQYGYYLKNNPSKRQFVSFDKQNVHLQARYIKKNGKVSNEEKLFKFSNGSFNLSPDALSSETIVAVVWYKTIHSFISNTFGGNIYGEVKRDIVTASVRPDPPKIFVKPVRISWNITGLDNHEECVYWKPRLNENKWKTVGCKRKQDNHRLTCECYHLTAFATLDISRDLVSADEEKALELISTIGCSLSLVGIFLTILTNALLWKKLQRNFKSNIPSQVLMHLCVAIGMTDIFAILAGPARSNEALCTAVSILLYFSIMAVFGWMLCEGIVIYLQLVNVFTGLGLGGRHLKSFYLIGWGIPVVVVSVMVGVNNRENFISKNACWCGSGGAIFWTFTATIAFILMINVVIFVLALRNALSSSSYVNTISRTPQGTTAETKASAEEILRKVKVRLRGSAVLLPLLGLTWVFGLLVFNREMIVFKYLFAVCNSLQGVTIFIFHVLINRKVREIISRVSKTHLKGRFNTTTWTPSENCDTQSTFYGRSKKSSIYVTTSRSKKNFSNQTLSVDSRYFTLEDIKSDSFKENNDSDNSNNSSIEAK